MGLSGKACVVTGASSGIGRRIALDLAGAGARVCVAARRAELLEELVTEMGGAARGHSSWVTDVGDKESVAALAEHVRAAHGNCHVLVNNAGIGGGGFTGEDSVVEVERVMRVNFLGAVYCTGALLDLLTRSRPSNVVNVASVAGRVSIGGSSSYCASKFALVGWSEALYQELAGRGICVSLVQPGFVETEGFPQDDLKRDRVMRHLLATTEDVSRAVMDAIAKRKPERVVPRYYHLAQIPKALAPPLWRWAFNKAAAPRAERRAEKGG